MKQSKRPVVLILGAGAVGLSLAGKLAGSATVFVACRPRHAAAIRENGLRIEGIWGDEIISGITCIEGPKEAPSVIDYICITAKGTDTEEICRDYAGVLKDRTVVSIQNGIGNEEIISGYTEFTIGGTVTTNFSVKDNGYVRVNSQSSPMILGPWSGSSGKKLEDLTALLLEAGVPVETTSDIKAGKWEKSLLNIAVNPVSALLSTPVGAAGDAHLRKIITDLIRETFAVMDAGQIRVPWATADDYLDYLFGVQVPDFAMTYPSMYYDIKYGRQTEIELLNGYVAKVGRELGIPTPYNRCITELIHFRESPAGI